MKMTARAGWKVLVLWAAFLAAAPSLAAQQLRLDAFPADGQLYARDAQNLAEVEVRGWVLDAGWDAVVLRVSTRSQLIDEQVLPLQYATTGAPFASQTTLRAGLRDYLFELALRGGGQEVVVATATSVVAGDVFLVQGQSNAVALDYWKERRANDAQSWWVRSFGTQALGSWQAENDRTWYLAEGQKQRTRGAVGTWALALGRRLVDELGVPVAILNGAVGGTGIVAHQRNDDLPTDTSTIYGRLLTRATNAGLRDQVRAIFWHQGEADGSNAVFYGQRFDRLIADWREDYAGLERVYVMQTRLGCGVPADSGIFEAQRALPLRHPELRLMSTSALPGHDGCHYYYAGYAALAEQLAGLVGQDLYGLQLGPAVAPPDALDAQRMNSVGDRVRIEFDAAGVGLVAQAGVEQDFVFEDGARVTRATAQGPYLLLELDRATTSSTVRYIGRAGGSDGFLVNARGVGALLFELPLR